MEAGPSTMLCGRFRPGSFRRAVDARKGVPGAVKRVVTSVAFVLSVLCPAFSCAKAQGNAALAGVVRDLHGTPQMGALIELLGPDAAVIAQTYTDDHGRYLLSALSPGQYQVRASAAFLLPSLRSNLKLDPGLRSVANLTMTAMIEVGVWFPAQKRGVDEPSDDWRWTLRSAANRPLLRLDDGDSRDPEDQEDAGSERTRAAATQARFTVSSGDGSFANGGTRQMFTVEHQDRDSGSEILRAGFAELALPANTTALDVDAGLDRHTSLGGESRVVAGFSSHPELSGASGSGLQAFTLASSEHIAMGDAVMIDAGTLLSAERLMENRVSSAPFVRVVVAPTDSFAVMYRYATEREVQGSDDLAASQSQPDILSDARGRPLPFNNHHQELAVSHVTDRDTETLTVYRDEIATAAVGGMGNFTLQDFQGMPVIADLGTSTFRAAVGGYQAQGLSSSWTHQFSSAIATSVVAEVGSTLQSGGQPLALNNLEQELSVRMRPAFGASLEGKVARTGTAYRAQYRWQPSRTLNTVDAYNTAPEQGFLGCSLRQKLWSGRRLQGLDAVIEATNLLEEGYQPVIAPDGETIFLAQVPRSMQAGLSFKF